MYVRRRVRGPFLRGLPLHISRKARIKTAAFIIVALLLFITITSLTYLNRVAKEMAVSDATDIVTVNINSSISERMKSEDMSYDRFVTLDKDANGLVTAIKTNMSEINTLSSDLLTDVIGKGDKKVLEMKIPMGNLIGATFLLGKGPDVPLDIIMLTSSRIEFRNDLVDAGINQTKHRIVFEVIVDIDVLLPWDIASTTVKNDVIIAETVIVGSVPNTYVSLEKTYGDYAGDNEAP